jgi:hypothetical protein
MRGLDVQLAPKYATPDARRVEERQAIKAAVRAALPDDAVWYRPTSRASSFRRPSLKSCTAARPAGEKLTAY